MRRASVPQDINRTFLAAGKWFRIWWPGTESNRRRRPFQGWIHPKVPAGETSTLRPTANASAFGSAHHLRPQSGAVERDAGAATESTGLFDCPVDVIPLAALQALLAQVTAADCGPDFFLRNIVRQGIDRICKINAVTVALIFWNPAEVIDRSGVDFPVPCCASVPTAPGGALGPRLDSPPPCEAVRRIRLRADTRSRSPR